jgi:sterol desaturase/sphingolipid hydroxylase (fatty acid hydroxylase superfamily)
LEAIIEYFKTILSAHRSAILVGGIAIFWIIENAVPLYRFKYNKIKHAGVNIFFTITSIVVNFLLAFILLKVSDWAVANHFGFLQWLPDMPLWAFAIVGILTLDLVGAWFIHWTQHHVRWMWRFHLVHHSDTHVDTTSANRHHPGESVFRFIFTTMGIFIAGAPMWLVFMYQAFSVALSQFNHANIILPRWLDNILSWAIVTPNMHHVHHHYMLPYTDTNFGNIFSIWDRLFGTFSQLDPDKLVYGIDTHMASAENTQIKNLLKIPFEAYRPPTT